ncbi:carbonic anhydrase family protein [Leuconostoc lactis]
MQHLDYKQQNTWRQADDTQFQSPIDIQQQQSKPVMASAMTLTFRGQTTYDDRIVGEQFLVNGTLQLDGETWQLERFHFHDGAEHLMDGQRHDAEIHFVFLQGERVLVLAVFADVTADAPATPIQAILNGSVAAQTLVALLPTDRAYYRYVGSLTTPPLGQDVTWLVLANPIAMTATDAALIHARYPENYRDVQDLAGREVLSVSGKNV